MMSGRERARPLLPNPGVGYRRRTRFSSPEIPSLLAGPPQELFEPPSETQDEFDVDYVDFKRTPSRERPAFHPYNNRNPRQERSNTATDGIPSLLDAKVNPPPLLPPQTLQKLRQSFRSFDRSEDFDDEDPYANEDPDPLDVALEEAETKQKIDHIIMVAQALKEKLDREEEMRQYGLPDESLERDLGMNNRPPPLLRTPLLGEQPCPPRDPSRLPRLMDLKPKIPSLLEINVPPPPLSEVVKENVMSAINDYVNNTDRMGACWNCDEYDHGFNDCMLPRLRVFCIRCGTQGVDQYSCPCQTF